MYDPPGAHGESIPTLLGRRPGMSAFKREILGRFGGRSLGVYSNRDIRGGTSTSLHAVSRAFDWSYPNRATALDAANWCVEHATELGVQAIHDYADHHDGLGRTWGHSQGWHYGRIGSLGGHWLHLELTVDAAADPNWADRLHRPPTPQPPADQEVDDMIAGFHRHDDMVCAVHTGGYKTWVPDHDTLVKARALASLAGIDSTVHDEPDADMWRAFGPILGPVPAGWDDWGCKV